MLRDTEFHRLDFSIDSSCPQFPGLYKYLKKRPLKRDHLETLKVAIYRLESHIENKLSSEELDLHIDYSFEFFAFYKWLAGDQRLNLERIPLPPSLTKIYLDITKIPF